MTTVRFIVVQSISVNNILAILLVFLSFVVVHSSYADDFSEAAKIQYLIASVEALQGATFIRNGREYDASSASRHLRLKLKSMGDIIKTVEDFIDLCASKSSLSGEPYLIRLLDGSTIKSELFFKDKLKALAAKKQQT